MFGFDSGIVALGVVMAYMLTFYAVTEMLSSREAKKIEQERARKR
ncbi:MAG: hypothetical protein ACFB0F_01805 [Neomegalonema sp.]